MKKILSLTFVMILSLFLVTGCSKVDTSKYFSDYTTKNLDEALTEEKIEHDFSSYKETDEQATIYLFRGNGCTHCKAFLTFLNSIIDEYGDYFKVVSYEVWYNMDNGDLMDEVGSFLGQNATGVPFIVIGDKVFGGYGETYNDSIKKAIKDLYDSNNKYDVFEEMEKDKIKQERKELLVTKGIPVLLIMTVVIVVVLIINNVKSVKLSVKINNLEEELKNIKMELEETKKTEKVDVKKERKAKTANKVKTQKKTK